MEKEARREWREEGKGSASSSSSSSSSLTYIHTHQAIVKANMFGQRVQKTSSPLSHALISTSTGASVCKQDLRNLPPFKLINSTQKKNEDRIPKKKKKKKAAHTKSVLVSHLQAQLLRPHFSASSPLYPSVYQRSIKIRAGRIEALCL